MFTDKYDRLAKATCQSLTTTVVYSVPVNRSALISTISLTSSDAQISSYVNILIDDVEIYTNLEVPPQGSTNLILDNVGIALNSSSSIKVMVTVGPGAYVSIFGATSRISVVSNVSDLYGGIYSVPSGKQSIINSIAVCNSSPGSASVKLSVTETAIEYKDTLLYQAYETLYKVSDNLSVTQYTLPYYSYYGSIYYLNGTYIYFAGSQHRVYTSTDLLSWSLVYSNQTYSSTTYSMLYGDGKLMIVLESTYLNGSLVSGTHIIYTQDLVSWTEQNLGYAGGIEKPFLYESTKFNKIARIIGNYLNTWDGSGWTNTGMYVPGEMAMLSLKKPINNKYYGFYPTSGEYKNRLMIYDLNDLNQNGSMKYQYIGLPETSETLLCNLIEWSIGYNGSTALVSPKYGRDTSSGTWYSTMTTGYISQDMQNWTTVTLPAIPNKSHVVTVGDKFILASTSPSSSTWYISDNGTTWTAMSGMPDSFYLSKRGQFTNYEQQIQVLPTPDQVIANLTLQPQETVLIKSGYTLSENNAIYVESNNLDVGIGIFGVEI